MAQKARKRGRIHLVFAPHGTTSRFLPKTPHWTPTHLLIENADAEQRVQIDSADLYGNSLFDRELKKHVEKVKQKGAKIFDAESSKTKPRELKYSGLLDNRDNCLVVFSKKPTFINFIKFLEADNALKRIREKNMAENSEEFFKQGGKVLVRVGIAHSVVSKMLQEKGIKTTRYAQALHFSPYSIATRLERKLTQKEIEMAYISMFLDDNLVNTQEKNLQFGTALSSALLEKFNNNVERKKLLAIIEANIKNHRFKELCDWIEEVVYVTNGLPKKPTQKQLKEWLWKNSLFWRRHQRAYAFAREERKKRRQG